MAYATQDWRNGDEGTPLSASRLQHIETGISEAHDAVEAKADSGDIPNVSEFVTEAEMNSALSGKADEGDIPDVSGLASQSSVDDLVTRIESLESAVAALQGDG